MRVKNYLITNRVKRDGVVDPSYSLEKLATALQAISRPDENSRFHSWEHFHALDLTMEHATL